MQSNTKASRTTTIRSGFWSGLLTVTLTASVLLWTTLEICTAVQDAHIEAVATRAVQSERTSETLPQSCRQFYNNGTDQWIECMGVGRK
jgi:hypothetical protein